MKLKDTKLLVNCSELREISPELVASLFADMGSDEMARFFNEVAKITEVWPKPFCFQMQWVIDDKKLTAEGSHVMSTIGKYGDANQGFGSK